MRYIKKYIGVLYNLLVCVTGGSLLMMIIWLLLQIFVFASFAIPSDSMEPVLIPGDYVLVNKMLKGPRISVNFNAMRYWSLISLIRNDGTV